MHITYTCTLAQTAPLLSRRLVTRQRCFFSKRVLAVCRFIPVSERKAQIFCWPKGTSLECVELIYVKITETACVSDEICRLFKEEKVGQTMSLGFSCIKCVGTAY